MVGNNADQYYELSHYLRSRMLIVTKYCFVKYATLEQAQRAIGAFNIPYTLPGATIHMKVRYAEREGERFSDYLLDENYILVFRLL
ncbi:hypothetical protein CASFOL_033068 [Castilleja foliolosa]|uniref:RRM domain-containing protein n=1 Tax=Castilleja foliolosa TaxID=1961234 RepID=A0ABD3C3X0_9LAMI